MPELQSIEFQEVAFSYPDLEVFSNLSLNIEPGKMTAIVGPSGAGKTTIFNLMARIVDPHAGQITLGGIDTQSMSKEELRTQIAVVAQESGIFDDTIRENIRFGKPGDVNEFGEPVAIPDSPNQRATENEILEAAEQALVTDFTSKLPSGLDTQCGPRGSKLSGGQRQRIAIARAFLKPSPILLLDEPTSALDSSTEERLLQRLSERVKKQTIVVIAHRLTTVKNADHIVVLYDGKVLEEGTHSSLMDQAGLYESLFNSQQQKPHHPDL